MDKRTSRGIWLLAFALLQVPHVAGAQSEGIKVHGRWIIDIREQNGTLVTHREFDNALITPGKAFLANILAGKWTRTGWQITLSDTTPDRATAPCLFSSQPNAAPWDCVLREASDPNQVMVPYLTRNLVVATTPDGFAVTLKGSVPAGRDGFIGMVTTQTTYCASPCSAPSAMNDFSRALPPPVAVVAGQIIQITVVFSFQ